jgi:hypothetical protein
MEIVLIHINVTNNVQRTTKKCKKIIRLIQRPSSLKPRPSTPLLYDGTFTFGSVLWQDELHLPQLILCGSKQLKSQLKK